MISTVSYISLVYTGFGYQPNASTNPIPVHVKKSKMFFFF